MRTFDDQRRHSAPTCRCHVSRRIRSRRVGPVVMILHHLVVKPGLFHPWTSRIRHTPAALERAGKNRRLPSGGSRKKPATASRTHHAGPRPPLTSLRSQGGWAGLAGVATPPGLEPLEGADEPSIAGGEEALHLVVVLLWLHPQVVPRHEPLVHRAAAMARRRTISTSRRGHRALTRRARGSWDMLLILRALVRVENAVEVSHYHRVHGVTMLRYRLPLELREFGEGGAD